MDDTLPFNLTGAIQFYNKTGKGLGAIRKHLLPLIYDFPRLNQHCTEEDCADFLLSFHPRISRLISRYETRGTNFEAYLQSCLVWHMKSYLAEKIHKKRQERVLYKETCESLDRDENSFWEVREDEPEFLFTAPAPKQPEDIKESLKIILLALKCTHDIDDAFISQIASRIGTHSSVVFHLVEILRTTMRKRTARIQYLKEQRRRNYFRLHYFQDMKKSCRDKFQLAVLDKKIRREKRRYAAVTRTLSITPKSPSHHDIARILGIPKGTIDSGYFYIRKTEERFWPA